MYQKFPEFLINFISQSFENKNEIEKLNFLSENFEKISFSTSFGKEDQVITDMIFQNDFPIQVFTIDTGRLFEETYRTWQRTLDLYRKKIDVFFPSFVEMEKYLTEKGTLNFYNSVENRKECCYFRKRIPLERALRNTQIWITGLRSEQSENRKHISIVEFDAQLQLIKVNLLIFWTAANVDEYLQTNQVPYNSLHDKGFVSIGCEPCTRAVRQDEDFRAGRWWWENKSEKECGLHTH